MKKISIVEVGYIQDFINRETFETIGFSSVTAAQIFVKGADNCTTKHDDKDFRLWVGDNYFYIIREIDFIR